MSSSYDPNPERFAPLPPITYVAFGLLFLLPGVGQIVAIILALKANNVNLRSYSRAFLIRFAMVVVGLAILITVIYSKGRLTKFLRNVPKAWKLLFP